MRRPVARSTRQGVAVDDASQLSAAPMAAAGRLLQRAARAGASLQVLTDGLLGARGSQVCECHSVSCPNSWAGGWQRTCMPPRTHALVMTTRTRRLHLGAA